MLSAPIRNYGDLLAVIFFKRRGSEVAESDYFLLAVDPPKKLADRKDGK
ncbi:hypothetical protein D1BOALGB6SA_10559 [Olavius sp. associated proteobacterium Delta 1]|nr:hypothetical protein D1BOALGB6SA_10559 [Olavius sp. associated proteobacterium Delta 1]